MHRFRTAYNGLALLLVSSCVVPGAMAQAAPEQRYPAIVAVEVKASGADTFDFDVTVSSPYDTPARYADGFRAMSAAGEVYGERKLLHDHRDEQPFTRDLYAVRIPPSIKQVVVQGRDQKHRLRRKDGPGRVPGTVGRSAARRVPGFRPSPAQVDPGERPWCPGDRPRDGPGAAWRPPADPSQGSCCTPLCSTESQCE